MPRTAFAQAVSSESRIGPRGTFSTPLASPATVAARAQEHCERAIKAQRDGNWALYGEEIERLGEIIGKMR